MEKLKHLRQNKDLLITRHDKGIGVFLMYRTHYNAKMQFILSEKEIINKTNNDKGRLCPVGTHIHRLYSLPKIQKDGVLVCRILHMKNVSNHGITRWLADNLKPIKSQTVSHISHKNSKLHCELITSNHMGVLINTFSEILVKYTCSTLYLHFLFYSMYRHFGVVAMDSPLGPLLANIFRGKLEAAQL
ncbi:unnamed protein product, partial [Dibothriocephalus latus]